MQRDAEGVEHLDDDEEREKLPPTCEGYGPPTPIKDDDDQEGGDS